MGRTETPHADETKEILQLIALSADLEHRAGWRHNFILLQEYKVLVVEGTNPRS